MIQLIVENEALDLSEKPIMSFQCADIADIESRQGDFSYQFDVPATQKNRRLLKRSHFIFGSPYQMISAWFRTSSDVKKGFIQVVEFDGVFKVNFFSGNSNWIALIGDKRLADLDTARWDHIYSAANVVASFGNTDGIIYPYMYVKSGPEREMFVGLTQAQSILADGAVNWDNLSGDFYNENVFETPYYTAKGNFTVSIHVYANITAVTGTPAYIHVVLTRLSATVDITSATISGTGVEELNATYDLQEGDTLHVYVDVVTSVTLGADSTFRVTTAFADLENINYSDLYPALYVHSVIKQIFQEIGFKLSGPFLNNIDYKRMIIPFSGDTFAVSGEVVQARSIYVSMNLPFTVITQPIFWDKETPPQFNGGLWSAPLYTADGNYKVDIYAAFGLSSLNGGATGVTLEIRLNGVTVLDTITTAVIDIHYLQKLNYTLAPGDTLSCWVTNIGGGSATFSPSNISYFKVTGKTEITSGDNIFASAILPDLKQIDLIKFVFVSFGIVPEVDDFSKTLKLTEFRAIKQNDSDDWSSKFISDYSLNFYDFAANFGKTDLFRYKDFDDELELSKYKSANPDPYGDGKFVLDNVFMTGEADIFQNEFVPVWFNEVEINDQSAHLTEYTRDKEPRVLFVIPNAAVADFASFSEINIDGYVYPLNYIAWAYFAKYAIGTDVDNFTTNLAYSMPSILNPNGEGLLAKYWEDYAGVLERPKMLIAFFKLTLKDIITLDYTKRKYIEGENITGYYFLNKIRSYDYDSGIAECELVLINNLDLSDNPLIQESGAEERESDAILQEQGDYILQEQGGDILIDQGI